MTRLLKLFSLLLLVNLAYMTADAENDACIQCHEPLDDDMDEGAKIFTNFYDDVHYELGLSCADCHGGDPTAFDDGDAAMEDDDTFLGEITRDSQPEMCGRCHSDVKVMRLYTANVKTDQLSQYWTSQHGIQHKLGNDKTAVCTDCHGLHGILPVSDPR